jgi:hypothetical protein
VARQFAEQRSEWSQVADRAGVGLGMTLISTLEPIFRDLGSVKAVAAAAITPRVYARHARHARPQAAARVLS